MKLARAWHGELEKALGEAYILQLTENRLMIVMMMATMFTPCEFSFFNAALLALSHSELHARVSVAHGLPDNK